MENPGEFEQNEVREQPTEVSEAGERLNDATHRPEEVVEFQGNIEEAEAVEQAFTEAVAAGGEERGAASSQALMPGLEDAEGGITISPVEGGASQSSSADEISATPITLPMEDPDGIPDAIGEVLEQESEGDEPELQIVDPDGETGDEFVGLDDGLEQTGDMRRPPNEDGGLDDQWGAEQGEAVGNLGEVDALGVEMPEQDDHGLGDPMSEGMGGGGSQGVLDGVMGFGEMGAGPDRESEMADLMDAALAGRGGLISDDDTGGTTGDTSGGSTGDTSGDSSAGASGSSSGDATDDSSGDSSGGASGGGSPQGPTPIPFPSSSDTTSSTGKKTDLSNAQGDDSGASPGARSGSAFPQSGGRSTGQRVRQTGIVSQSYDPEGTVESAGGEPDRTLGGLVEDPLDHDTPLDDTDLQGSMSQPVGEEGTRSMESTPPPELGEQALSGNLDPYINWGDSGGQGGGEIDMGQFDADEDLIDPPEPDMGDGMQDAAGDEP